MNEKYTLLINADIDGELDDADRAELQAFLDEHAEGRALQDELSALCARLDAVESVDPPAHLRHVIMNTVQSEAGDGESPGFLQTLLATPALKYAATFAAGVALTLSIVNSGQISDHAFDDVTDLVGTLAAPINARTSSFVSINEVEVAGTVALRSSGKMLILDFDLAAREPIEVEADYTDRTIWFNGFAQLESTGTNVSAQAGRVRVGMEGKRRYAVYLHNEGGRETTVSLRFLANGEVVHEASLGFSPAD